MWTSDSDALASMADSCNVCLDIHPCRYISFSMHNYPAQLMHNSHVPLDCIPCIPYNYLDIRCTSLPYSTERNVELEVPCNVLPCIRCRRHISFPTYNYPAQLTHKRHVPLDCIPCIPYKYQHVCCTSVPYSTDRNAARLLQLLQLLRLLGTLRQLAAAVVVHMGVHMVLHVYVLRIA